MANIISTIKPNTNEYAIRSGYTYYGTTTGTSSALKVTITDDSGTTINIPELTKGLTLILKLHVTPTASATLAVNNLTAKSIKYGNDAGGANWEINNTYVFVYNGTNFVAISTYDDYVVTTTGSGNAITKIEKSGKTITATKGSTFLTGHPSITTNTDTTSAQTVTHSGTFTVVDSVTRDGNGHVTKVNTKTITLPGDNDSHYTSKNIVGNSASATGNATATNGNVYLNHLEEGTITSKHKIVGDGATKVTSDANGNITISSTDTNTTYSVATASADGLMSKDDKSKLNGIAAGANNYSLPTASSSALGGVKLGYTQTGKNYPVVLDNNNKAYVNVPWTDTNTNTTYSAGSGLSLSGTTFNHSNSITAVSTTGLYKIAYDENGHITSTKAVEKGDITALGIPSTNTTYSVATASADGLMSKDDKSKLNGIAAGATANTGTVTSITPGTGLTGTSNDTAITTSGTINLKTASSSEIGGIKIGYTQSGKNYPVVLDSNNKAYVNVPWTDNNTTYGVATASANGLMSSTDKSKLDGIASGAEVNQNAFSNITIDSTTIKADSKTDTLTLAAGSNITLTPDATNGKITITATDTNTWRPISDSVSSTDSSTSASSTAVKTAYDKAVSAYNLANGKTANTGTVTSITPGTGLTGASSDTAITTSGTINLKTASSSEIGGIKIGFTQSGKNYPVVLDSNNKAYVNVPWTNTDTNTHYTSKNVVGASESATGNATATNGSVYLNHLEENTVKSSHKIVGSGATKVTSDDNGNITIESPTIPTIPSVGNAKITIKQGSQTLGSFTTNQAANATINIPSSNSSNSVAVVGLYNASEFGDVINISSSTDAITEVYGIYVDTQITEMKITPNDGCTIRLLLTLESGLSGMEFRITSGVREYISPNLCCINSAYGSVIIEAMNFGERVLISSASQNG